jgi:phage terminase small subunit
MNEITRAGIQVTPAQRAPLALASTIAADMAEAYDEIKDTGAYELNEKTGATQLHPAAKRFDALRRDLLKALAQIGLRPGTSTEAADGETLEDVLARTG